jgi:deoxyhypusine monooxygenase
LKDPSALFRHEIAFVFGQMRHVDSIPFLINVLQDLNEPSMVRHEAAEALGSIATAECLPILKKYSTDTDKVVADSCIIGLDMYEYENSNEFQPS